MSFEPTPLNRRTFLQLSALAGGSLTLGAPLLSHAAPSKVAALSVSDLPVGNSPAPLSTPHFPDRLHAFVWRNWALVPAKKMAEVVGATTEDILHLGRSMGLPPQPKITENRQRRSYITVLRRNWHLLPYDQLLQLLGWTAEKMAYTLREDDFLYVKLGNLKPKCDRLTFSPQSPEAFMRSREIAQILAEEFPSGLHPEKEPLFQFVSDLSKAPQPQETNTSRPHTAKPDLSNPRFCYSYFALYGDPLLEPEADPFPEGYLARLARAGVNGIWLQAVLFKLAPFPWDSDPTPRHEQRLKALRSLVARARKHGIGVYLYLNEPRSMPLRFFESRPELRGVVEGDHAALCTSAKAVQNYLHDSIAHICRAVPDLTGFFTISASENLSNCWSHGAGSKCPRCSQRPAADVIAEVHRVILEGIRSTDSKARLIAWDWGWNETWVEGILNQLPKDVALMSVSEWDLPLNRGGIPSVVGEYSISAVGPGPRAQRHWAAAQARGLKTLAKIQAGTTWELSAVPYLPAVANVARHAANLRQAGISGLMLGWTLGGYPSPNLEVVSTLLGAANLSEEDAMLQVADRRFGKTLAPHIVAAWKSYSSALSEFPYHGGVVYSAPLQSGPANPLWGDPTGYSSSMVGFPYDHLDGWRAVYPAEVFIQQFEKVADGFEAAVNQLKSSTQATPASADHRLMFQRELSVAEAAMLHFRSVALQSRFVLDRSALTMAKGAGAVGPILDRLKQSLERELIVAKRMFELQSRDSRLGFEATNHYFYTPLDLVEKILNCRDLLDRWLPSKRKNLGA